MPKDARLRSWNLRDQHGPWCAWCLDYFSPELLDRDRQRWLSRSRTVIPAGQRPEKHHIIARRDLSGRLIGVVGGDRPLTLEVEFPKSWTVEVHERCHRLKNSDGNIQRSADSAANALEHLLRAAQSITEDSAEREFQALDRHVLRAFESGQYSVALFLNDAVRSARLKRGEPDAAADTLRHQLSARAGIRGKAPLDLRLFLNTDAANDASALLYVASHQASVGDFAAARATLARAHEIAPSAHNFHLDFALREAKINHSLPDAGRALQLAAAEATPYRHNTALVVAGLLALSEGDLESRGYFEAVLASQDASWLYRAESWFGLGCLALEAGQLTDAYRLLIASQYVYGFLGLQPLPHEGLRIPGGEDPTCLPFDLLRSDRFSHLQGDQCRDLRQQAIIGGMIHQRLIEDLGGLPKMAVDPPDPLRVRA